MARTVLGLKPDPLVKALDVNSPISTLVISIVGNRHVRCLSESSNRHPSGYVSHGELIINGSFRGAGETVYEARYNNEELVFSYSALTKTNRIQGSLHQPLMHVHIDIVPAIRTVK
jgi:hypothetical protein